MDLASFLLAILPVLAVGLVCVVAFRRRRRRTSPLILNPYTLVVELEPDSRGKPPVVPPPTTTSSRPPLRARPGSDGPAR